ncbi:DotA/TraY family protein [Gammaproteobacteria bacterium]|nr:DotA/TraY family protein [Gammaproteobacteria bacterium]
MYIFMTIFPLLGLAAGTTENMLFGNSTLAVLTYDSTYDISLKFLKLLFGGEVGLDVDGFGNGYAGTIFAYFNYGLLVIIFGYSGLTAFEATLLAGTEGSMFRRKIKPLVMVRTVAGISLVAPNISGYCLAQKFLIQVVVMGVGMANGVWIQGIEYADAFNGSAYISSPSGKFTDVQTIAKDLMLPVYQSTYCVQKEQKLAKAIDPNMASSDWSMRIGKDCGSNDYAVCFGSSKNQKKCGHYGFSNGDTTRTTAEKVAVQQSIISAGTVLLGVAINQLLLEDSGISNGCDSQVAESCVPAVMIVNVANNFYTNLLAFRTKPQSGQQSIVSYTPNEPGTASITGTAKQKGWASAGSYFNQLVTGKVSDVFGVDSEGNSIEFEPLSSYMPPKSPPSSTLALTREISSKITVIVDQNKGADKAINFAKPSFEDEAIARSILKMMNMVITENTFVDDVDSKYVVIGSVLNNINLSVGFKNLYALLAYSTQDFTGIQILGTDNWNDVVTHSWNSVKINRQCLFYLKAYCQNPPSSSSCMNELFSNSTCVSDNGVGLVSQMKRRWEIDNQAETSNKSLAPINPFYAMVMIGKNLVRNSAQFWKTSTSETVKQLVLLTWVLYAIKIGVLTLSMFVGPICLFFQYCIPIAFGASALASLVMQGVSYVFAAAAFIIDIPSGLGNALATIIYSLGNFLGYFLPFLPMVVFTMAVIGWMMLVIEAMVATPLVALGLTSPKGHDYLGQAQQSIMMYVAVCLRPVLIIISFFIVINLLYVGFEYLNYVYLIALSKLLDITISTQSLNLVIVFASMLVYAYFCFTLLIYILETINEIPDRVSRWIGGTMLSPGGNIHQMVSEMKGGSGGAAQGAASGASGSAASITQGVSGIVAQGAQNANLADRAIKQALRGPRKGDKEQTKEESTGIDSSTDPDADDPSALIVSAAPAAPEAADPADPADPAAPEAADPADPEAAPDGSTL